MNQIQVGITGHRDLRSEDLLNLSDRVREFFEKVERSNPGSDLILMSPLADGADRLVAKLAIEVKWKVIALLPMPVSEYENDFETAESLTEFRELLEQVDRCVEIPLVEGNTLENIQGWGENRAKQYVFVGAYTVRHSHILLALWNGEDPKLPGGTAEVVQFMRTGEIPAEFEPTTHPVPPTAGGSVYHIVTPRKSNPVTVGSAFEVKEYESR
ncbi:hypothetical protein JJB07_04310 [Tumebacillus sp. ITR2]|uniref:Uncharacterized protein n=1 Tax=Tumebacillus amylolyticus TaxID=2801339 RepID=A0ABS1J6F5_9BACL|nr:hypothetical protein [Tumebacillus amylolyticus]MBL0385866.1 hypothetical protein [Tumebacillus amylolyticus]